MAASKVSMIHIRVGSSLEILTLFILILYVRWLGPKRYEISGAKTWMNNKGYEGTISFKVDETNSTSPTNLENRCVHRCPTCEEVSKLLDKVDTINEDEHHLKGDAMLDNTIPHIVTSTKVIEGKFMSITGAVMSCMSPKSPLGLTPSAHLGDGNLDLIVVNKTSRVNYLRYLIRTNMPSSNNSPFQLPFVQVHRVKEFTFSPIAKRIVNDENEHSTTDVNSEDTSVWNCDGEIILSPSIHAKVYCQILPVFARGIE